MNTDLQEQQVEPGKASRAHAEKQYLLQFIGDERTKELIFETWSNLPRPDQMTLACLPLILLDDDECLDSYPRNPETMHQSFSPYGLSFSVPNRSGLPAVVVLRREHSLPDLVYKFVIAHELAHALLRHPQLNWAFHESQIIPAEWDGIRAWMDEQANMQVSLWGLHDEIVAAANWSEERMDLAFQNSRVLLSKAGLDQSGEDRTYLPLEQDVAHGVACSYTFQAIDLLKKVHNILKQTEAPIGDARSLVIAAGQFGLATTLDVMQEGMMQLGDMEGEAWDDEDSDETSASACAVSLEATLAGIMED